MAVASAPPAGVNALTVGDAAAASVGIAAAATGRSALGEATPVAGDDGDRIVAVVSAPLAGVDVPTVGWRPVPNPGAWGVPGADCATDPSPAAGVATAGVTPVAFVCGAAWPACLGSTGAVVAVNTSG
jgi:hypothetical protein